MDELFELIPGSRAARKNRCSCLVETQLDPGCPIHGMSAFRRLRQKPEGRSVVERYCAGLQSTQLD
jgi:hypothetical protein